MRQLSDELLLEAFHAAKDLRLDKTFLRLIELELKSRKLEKDVCEKVKN
ncbi:MAG TPA: sporulation histidine kinase inhibitor Sda [Bacillales bacterium]|nr:sporulation histidine kinase inhibitor Sda [Bacillales bacterium]